MTTFDAASRFKLTEAPALAPGVCYVTRSDKGPFVDTGVDMRFSETGRLYLAVSAIREMAEGAGLFDSFHDSAGEAYRKGKADGLLEGIEGGLSGDIRNLVDRLDGLAARLGGRPDVVDVEDAPALPVDDTGDEPLITVVDGPDDEKPRKRADKAARADGAARGQVTGAGVDDRPTLVPVGASDVNPFRI